ncbi:MAG: PQQ-dependent sugar dehydrogenase [Pseudomonadota bacterium]|nr:PQQ-dependent sugar dehydrogenase [Pseudomonadota bacterium]
MRPLSLAFLAPLALIACTGAGEGVEAGNGNASLEAGSQQPGDPQGRPFRVEVVADFDEPWAMTFLPGTEQALISEKPGRLLLWTRGRDASAAASVAGVPEVDYGGQGGFGDVVAHPDFAENRLVYLSWVEAGEGDTRGAVVGRARLVAGEGGAPRLEGLQVIWRQHPKVTGRGHFGHRLAFSPDGYLFITNGDRQKFDPAQDNSQHLGTIVRLHDDGRTPSDNPFAGQGAVQSQIWSYGHRNPVGIAFDASGNLWSHEMGPRHGDEFNLILPGRNYGYPLVSEGDHYEGRPIPGHETRPEFEAPKIFWVPAISPAGLIVYSGGLFPEWRGSAFLGGLSGEVLVRVALDGTNARVADRWAMGARIREVEQGPDGAIYLLEDERGSSQGRLLRLTPAR